MLRQPGQVSKNWYHDQGNMRSNLRQPVTTSPVIQQRMEEPQTAVLPWPTLSLHWAMCIYKSPYAYRALSHALTVSLYLCLLKPLTISTPHWWAPIRAKQFLLTWSGWRNIQYLLPFVMYVFVAASLCSLSSITVPVAYLCLYVAYSILYNIYTHIASWCS